ncbi:MAG: tRNA pseudouridine(13) synthase TruD [Phycisphaerales bacterium]|nr:tRNA pseudouridine(13) synthase TruD [Phycisphaerales bacterium]
MQAMTTTQAFDMTQLPYLTADAPPVPAVIKRDYEDFRVEEVPAYEPCGEGDHCFFMIEKKGLATMRAVSDIARKLGVPAKAIGLAGLKDARAVAVQTLSVEHIDPGRIENLQIPRIRILSVSRHKNKLKIGHLRGNRFHIKLRDTDPGRLDDIRSVCETLVKRGVPNYFGQQRFGTRGDTWQLGKAALGGDVMTVVDLMLGRPGPHDTGDVLKARRLYDEREFAAAAKAWPYLFRDHARVGRVMERTKGNHRRAFHAIDARLKKFFINAYQSYLFNQVLAKRIQSLDLVRTGDLAYKHDHGGVFLVEDESVESRRAAAFEISPTGPIFGHKMTRPQGEPEQLEQAILESEGIQLEEFHKLKRMKLHGSRRPLRFRPDELDVSLGADALGPFIELAFTLPAGCYATMILRETCKQGLQEGRGDEDG